MQNVKEVIVGGKHDVSAEQRAKEDQMWSNRLVLTALQRTDSIKASVVHLLCHYIEQ